MQKELYYATGNAGKMDEVKVFFAQAVPDIVVKQFAVDIEEIQTLDQKAIAIDKVQKAWQQLKKPVLVDDSGIFFEDYPQFPGTLSKFVYKTLGFEGIFKLVNENARAAFILQLAYTDGEIIKTFEGRCDGVLVHPVNVATYPQMPFKTIFKPDGSDLTYAELYKNPAEFAKFAFRKRALEKFLDWYKA